VGVLECALSEPICARKMPLSGGASARGPLDIHPSRQGWTFDESLREELPSLSLIFDVPQDVDRARSVSHLPVPLGSQTPRLHQRVLPRRLLGGRRRPTSANALNSRGRTLPWPNALAQTWERAVKHLFSHPGRASPIFRVGAQNCSCRLSKPCGGPPPPRRRHHRPPTEPTEAAAATRRPQHAHASSPSGVADGTRTRTPPCTCASTGAGARGTVCAMTMRRRHTPKVAVRRSEVAAARAWTALTAAYGPSGRRWPAGRCRRAEADRRGGGGCRRGRCSTSRFARS
jgi:hypothetical protein